MWMCSVSVCVWIIMDGQTDEMDGWMDLEEG